MCETCEMLYVMYNSEKFSVLGVINIIKRMKMTISPTIVMHLMPFRIKTGYDTWKTQKISLQFKDVKFFHNCFALANSVFHNVENI